MISGARGFMGRNLVEYLSGAGSGRYILFYPYHNDLELLDTKKVEEYVSSNGIDIIIHCANIGGTRKTDYDISGTDVVFKNMKMFLNLVRLLGLKRRMIFLGSGAEYGLRHYKPGMREEYFDAHMPEDAYGFSKYTCSKYIENSKNIVNLRFFGVFGRYEDYEYRFISNSIVKNLLGMPIVINQNVYFDYLYADDAVRIIERFIERRSRHKFYNAARGETIDLITIAGKINKIAEKPSEVIVVNPGLNTEYSGDNARLLKELKGFRFTPFDRALAELYSWYKSNMDKISRESVIKDEYIKYCRVKL